MSEHTRESLLQAIEEKAGNVSLSWMTTVAQLILTRSIELAAPKAAAVESAEGQTHDPCAGEHNFVVNNEGEMRCLWCSQLCKTPATQAPEPCAGKGEANRAAADPGGMECERCGRIFIGAEWHSHCGICHADKTASSPEAEPAGPESDGCPLCGSAVYSTEYCDGFSIECEPCKLTVGCFDTRHEATAAWERLCRSERAPFALHPKAAAPVEPGASHWREAIRWLVESHDHFNCKPIVIGGLLEQKANELAAKELGS